MEFVTSLDNIIRFSGYTSNHYLGTAGGVPRRLTLLLATINHAEKPNF
jgi:hypothetical protein